MRLSTLTRVLVLTVPFFLYAELMAQETPYFKQIGAERNSPNGSFHILFLTNETDSLEKAVGQALFNQGLVGIEMVYKPEKDVFKNLERIISDGIQFDRINPSKIYVTDLSEGAEASLALTEFEHMLPAMTIVFGKYNALLFNRLPGAVRFYQRSTAKNKAELINALDFDQPKRKWGFEVNRSMMRNSRRVDSTIQTKNRGLFQAEFQLGTWFLLSEQDIGNEEFNIANSGRHYKLNFGYGLSDHLVIQAGLGVSFKLPNEDEQRAALSNATVGTDLSNQTRNQIILSPAVGLKYYFNQGSRFKYYGLLGYERVNMELTNFKVFTNSNGDIRDRYSSISKNFNGLRYGLGMEATLSPRLYLTLQFEGLKSESFNEPVNGVTNFDHLNFNFGVGFKLGSPQKKKRH